MHPVMRNPKIFGMISAALQSASEIPEEDEVTPEYEAPEDISDQTDDTSEALPETTGFTFGSRFGTKR